MPVTQGQVVEIVPVGCVAGDGMVLTGKVRQHLPRPVGHPLGIAPRTYWLVVSAPRVRQEEREAEDRGR